MRNDVRTVEMSSVDGADGVGDVVIIPVMRLDIGADGAAGEAITSTSPVEGRQKFSF